MDNTIAARLDVTTWQLHPGSPAAVDAHADRNARWSLTLSLTMTGISMVCGMASPFAPLALVGALVAAGIALLTWHTHRHLRTRTGLPVVPELHDLLKAYTILLDYDAALIRRLRDNDEQQQADEFDATRLREQPLIVKVLMPRCEMAALAHRRGWNWLHDRHVRQLHQELAPVLKRLHVYAPENAETDQPTSPAERAPEE